MEEYGAQPPIELLRQFMDHSGWYDRKELTMRKLVDVQFVGAMGPPGGGRNAVTNRYLRHFSVVSLTAFDTDNLRCVGQLRCAVLPMVARLYTDIQRSYGLHFCGLSGN